MRVTQTHLTEDMFELHWLTRSTYILFIVEYINDFLAIMPISTRELSVEVTFMITGMITRIAVLIDLWSKTSIAYWVSGFSNSKVASDGFVDTTIKV